VSFSLLNKYIKFRDCLSHFSGFIFTIDSTSYKFAPLDSAAWDAMRSSPPRTGLVMTFARRSRGMAVDCYPVEDGKPNPCRPRLLRLPYMPAQNAGIYGARIVLFRPGPRIKIHMWATRPNGTPDVPQVYVPSAGSTSYPVWSALYSNVSL
jgi:hypothetical protein